jgi:hypothetical protein
VLPAFHPSVVHDRFRLKWIGFGCFQPTLELAFHRLSLGLILASAAVRAFGSALAAQPKLCEF